MNCGTNTAMRTVAVCLIGAALLLLGGHVQTARAADAPEAGWTQAERERSPRTDDGRKYTDLKEENLDSLEDSDWNKYQKWRIKTMEARGEELDKQLTAKQTEMAITLLRACKAAKASGNNLKGTSQLFRDTLVQSTRYEYIKLELRAELRACLPLI